MTTRSAVLGTYRTTGAREAHAFSPVPSGEVWIVKSVVVTSEAATVQLAQAWIQRSPPPTLAFLLRGEVAVGELLEWAGWVVAEAGDQLSVYADGPLIDFWISGARLVTV